jgi:hypothetical protein
VFNIGDIVGYSTARNLANNKVYGIVVGFTHNEYYYIDWFDYGCDWTSPYHHSALWPVETSEGT